VSEHSHCRAVVVHCALFVGGAGSDTAQ